MARCFLRELLLMCLLGLASCYVYGQPVREPRILPEWQADYPPFRIAGNLYYVGTEDLACYLITTPKGHILINTGLSGSDSLLDRHLKTLGFNLQDVKLLLIQQAHYDHTGALAAIKARTGAQLWADAKDADVLRSGGAADYEMGKYGVSFKPVKPDRLLQNDDRIAWGGMTLTMLHHPGHTRGSCSYLFTVKDSAKSYRVLLANMPTIIVDGPLKDITAYPDIARDYAYTFQAMKAISFDIWLAAHAGQFDMHTKHKPGDAYNPAAFADPAGYAAELAGLQNTYEQKRKP